MCTYKGLAGPKGSVKSFGVFFLGGVTHRKGGIALTETWQGPGTSVGIGRDTAGRPTRGLPHQCLCQANQRTLGPIVVFQMISEPNPRLQQRTPLPQIPDEETLP